MSWRPDRRAVRCVPASTASYVPQTALQRPAGLAYGRARGQCHPERLAEASVVLGRRRAQRGERALDLALVTARTVRSQPVDLPLLGCRIDALELGLDRLALVHEAVDSHDRLLARLDAQLRLEGLLLDALLHPARLDRRDRAAQLVDLGDQPLRLFLQRVGQLLDVVRAAERIGRGRDAGLGREDLLGAERKGRRLLGRQRERLVERVRVQRLAAAGGGGERLQRHPHDVVQRLLGRQRRARRSGRGSAASASARRARRTARASCAPTCAGPRGTSRPRRTRRCAR